jgi:hypothetical protein
MEMSNLSTRPITQKTDKNDFNIGVSTNPGTNFYNRYLLNNPQLKNMNFLQGRESPASDVMLRNVLKNQYTLNYTDYEKLKLAEQYNKLYLNSMTESDKLAEIEENKKVYNMSLKLLAQNASNVYIQMINELTNYLTYNDEKSLNQIGYILSKGENMIYVGILVIIISFSLWLIDVTS